MSKFSEAVHGLFHNERLRKILLSYRMLLIPAALAVVLYFSDVQYFWYAFGVSLFGELIQLWCFASLDKQSELAYNGLYKYTRNPMYLGRFFIVLGFFLLLGNLYIILPLTIIYYLYMWHRVQREERKLIKIFGQPYEEYCQRVNRFFPSLRGMPDGTIRIWKWKLFNQNHGWINLAGMLVLYAAAYLWFFFNLRDKLGA
jgi:protein-S-isoprenylcysteine O-methyltransferase Ste14